ncbi:MAG TPA: hypothetical protein VNL77_18635 [Roseiflexaceae bacterium]|nr:hypothetical protein [Roseiflexaceae bacterium]
MDDLDPAARVLVCVVTRPADLELARTQGWYRVPVRRAPRGLAAEHLAFYQTAAFGAERWAVRYLAAVRRVTLATRRELLPHEFAHPRADERYFRFDIGPLRPLPLPLPARRLRRVTFIPTTLGQLLRAHDVAELWRPPEDGAALADAVWGAGVNRDR